VRTLANKKMQQSKLLKSDIFGEIRIVFGDDGDVIVRDTSSASVWIAWLARALMRREARILALLDGLHGVPTLLDLSRTRLRRNFVAGLPMQEAKPADPAYFKAAAELLRKLHRLGVAHNDLAKEPNLLLTAEGQPAFLDFQLAVASRHRGRVFRLLAYDDIRHLLKHKRTYCPQALSEREQRILENPSCLARVWMQTIKPVYLFMTRRVLGWSDREGAANRGQID